MRGLQSLMQSGVFANWNSRGSGFNRDIVIMAMIVIMGDGDDEWSW